MKHILAIPANRPSTSHNSPNDLIFKLISIRQDHPYRRLSPLLCARFLPRRLRTFCGSLSAAMGRRIRSRGSDELFPFACYICGTGSATAGRLF